MKKALVLVVVALVAASVGASAAPNDWSLRVNGVVCGVAPDALDGEDARDTKGFLWWSEGHAFTASVRPGTDYYYRGLEYSAYKADFMSPALCYYTENIQAPYWGKCWRFRVASFEPASGINIQIATNGAAYLPPAGYLYTVKMLDDKGRCFPTINGMKWTLPVPTADVGVLWEISLPAIWLWDGHEELGVDGYLLELVQTPVPEPASALVLGSGILALAGMIRRRR
jgi:hypothetical protein